MRVVEKSSTFNPFNKEKQNQFVLAQLKKNKKNFSDMLKNEINKLPK